MFLLNSLSGKVGFLELDIMTGGGGGGGGLTRFLPPLQQIGHCGCGIKRQKAACTVKLR